MLVPGARAGATAAASTGRLALRRRNLHRYKSGGTCIPILVLTSGCGTTTLVLVVDKGNGTPGIAVLTRGMVLSCNY
eukprot:1679676-Rhodomonas_salina.1